MRARGVVLTCHCAALLSFFAGAFALGAAFAFFAGLLLRSSSSAASSHGLLLAAVGARARGVVLTCLGCHSVPRRGQDTRAVDHVPVYNEDAERTSVQHNI